jgi:hypothetical protein
MPESPAFWHLKKEIHKPYTSTHQTTDWNSLPHSHCWQSKRDTPCTPILLALEEDTPCTFILLAIEKGYTLCVHAAGFGRGDTLHVHTADGGRGYTLHVHTTGGGRVYSIHPACSYCWWWKLETPCTFILLAVEGDTPCTSILLVLVVG